MSGVQCFVCGLAVGVFSVIIVQVVLRELRREIEAEERVL
jgi:hypothetical protein